MSNFRILLACLMLSGCIAASPLPGRFALNEDTTDLAGWFLSRGEWTLFPASDFAAYTPYDLPDDQKCVSLINNTDASREAFAQLHGSRVRLHGYTLPYDELEEGNSAVDQIMSRRYFEDDIVFNSCLRDLVFVVTRIE
tara:strand:+ start:169 stop:585 length:417 start_codon:yes stop_codon:yes gene_type:complete